MQLGLEWSRSRRKAIGSSQLQAFLICAYLLFFPYGCAREFPTYEPAELPVSLVVQQLKQRQDYLLSYRAVGSLRVQGGKQRWSGRAFLLSQFPESLRLEVVSLFGHPVLYAASDGQQFTVWDPNRNRAYQGSAANNTLAHLIEFPLQDQEALLMLAGIVPSYRNGKHKLFKVRGTESLMLQLEGAHGGLTQRVWLEGEGLVVTRIERTREGEREMEARFSDFIPIGGSYYPRSVVMEGAKARLTLKYQEFVVNEELDESVFHLPLPGVVEIIPW